MNLRKLIAGLLALLVAVQPAAAQQFRPGGFVGGFRSGFQFLGGAGGFPTPGAVVDYDFANNRYSGPAISVSNASGGYVDDTSGNWTLVPSNTLRRSNKGVLVEGAQTNSIRNNSMQGAVAGTPGTLPTNWSVLASVSGIASQVVGTGTESGIDYLDLRLSGTSTAAGTFVILSEPTTNIAAASGQIWTGSTFLKLQVGSLNSLTVQTGPTERTTAGASVADALVTAGITGAALGTQRFNATRTITQTTGVITQKVINVNIGSGVAVDITIRIGWPQLEQWNTSVTTVGGASSPIRTTGTAATRAADVVTAPVAGNPGAFTVAAVAQTPQIAMAGNQALAVVSNGTNNERGNLYRQTGGNTKLSVNSSTGSVGPIGSATVAAGTRFAIAGAFVPSDKALSVNANGPDTSVTANGYPTSVTQTNIGTFADGSAPWNGYIERLAIYPYRAANSNLQQLSTLANWGG
jgi:hypothetical protein